MKIRERIEGWLLNRFGGKILARLAVTIVAYLASAPIQALLAKAGISLAVNPDELTAGLIAGAHAIFEWFKARRAANPASPAIQTDASKPGAEISALAATKPK